MIRIGGAGKNVDISDLRSEIFNNIEQQDSGDFLRQLLKCPSLQQIKPFFNFKHVEILKCSNCDYRRNRQIDENLVAQLHIPESIKCTIKEVISYNYDSWRTIESSICTHSASP